MPHVMDRLWMVVAVDEDGDEVMLGSWRSDGRGRSVPMQLLATDEVSREGIRNHARELVQAGMVRGGRAMLVRFEFRVDEETIEP